MADTTNLDGSGIYDALMPASGRKRILVIGDQQADQMYGGKLYRAIYKLHPNLVGWWSGGAVGIYSSDDPVQCEFDEDATGLISKGNTGHAWDRYADPDDTEADGRNRVFDTSANAGDGMHGVTGNSADSDSPAFPSATQEIITDQTPGNSPSPGSPIVTWVFKQYGTSRDDWLKNNALEATVFVLNPAADGTGVNPITGAIPWSIGFKHYPDAAYTSPDGTGTLIAGDSTGIQSHAIDITEGTGVLRVGLLAPDDEFDISARRSVPLGILLEATEGDVPTGVSFVFYTVPWNCVSSVDGAAADVYYPLLAAWETTVRTLQDTIGFDAVVYWLGTEVERGNFANKSFSDVEQEMSTYPYPTSFDPGINAVTNTGQGRGSENFADITHGFRTGAAQDADVDDGVPVLMVLAGFAGQTDGLDAWTGYHQNWVLQSRWFVGNHTDAESKYTTGNAAYVDLARLASAIDIMTNQSNPWIERGCSNYRGDWDASTAYSTGDGVCLREADFTPDETLGVEPFRNGSHSYFVALRPNTNSKPIQAGTDDWIKMDFTRTVTGAEREWQYVLDELNRSQLSGASSADVSSTARTQRAQRAVRSQR